MRSLWRGIVRIFVDEGRVIYEDYRFWVGVLLGVVFILLLNEVFH